ncbi:MAG: tetratricopeptide repeat protein [Cyclobacteriaceae bacterium]|nr:tetratricopeptide repeat protein [Cyclobacteriaceae bacterium]
MRVQNFLNTQWKALAVVALTLFYISATAQPTAAKKDTTIILISDITMQIEISQALNDLYNFKFEKAEQQFRWFKQKYKWHPLPYFLLGLSEWWKIMPNTKATTYDEQFLAYMDSTIMVGENLYKKYPQYKIESAFFLAAAHGFKGRLYSDEERKSWRKAAVEGKSALNYMEVCREMDHLSPELLFGDALYNYFSVWVPENYPALKPLLWFFRKGDKQLGLKQLREVSYNAFYTRTEAMVWLMRISNSYENDQVRAFQIAEYLYTTYPDNPYFDRYYARMLYARGQHVQLEKQAKQILARIDSGRFGYEATSGRYAAFFLGQMYEFQRKTDEAKKYYELAVKYAEEIGATESGYYLFSLIALGEINEKQGNKAEAKRYFTEVKKRSGRKDEAYKDAKKRLKNLEKGD